jgi:hypothetical protein
MRIKMIKTLSCGKLKVILDSSEYFPNDPGAGCPALVVHGNSTASYNCAVNEGELGCGEYQLSESQMRWLFSIESTVEKFFNDCHSGENK